MNRYTINGWGRQIVLDDVPGNVWYEARVTGGALVIWRYLSDGDGGGYGNECVILAAGEWSSYARERIA